MDKRRRGFIAENYAANLLEKRGYTIIARNFKTRYSEIDIIALKENTLVFVEVKARWNLKHGMPEEAVNYRKIQKIKYSAEIFCLKNRHLPKKLLIEVISLIIKDNKVMSEKIIKAY